MTNPTCAKCGACTAVCPVYRVSGRESLTARGKVHLLSNLPAAQRGPDFDDIFWQCLLCGACGAVCPRGLDINGIIIAARAELNRPAGRRGMGKKLALKTLASPKLLKRAAGLLQAASTLLDKLPKESGLRLKLDNISASEASRRPYQDDKKDTGAATIAYFTGCFANFINPTIGHDTDLIVAKISGAPTLAPKQQNCCGLAALAAGDIQSAKDLARRNISAFMADDKIGNLPILTSCASCYSHIKNYGALLADDDKWCRQAASFSTRVIEFSSWLQPQLEANQHTTPANSTIFYHDPCHLRYASKITSPPRQLIKLLTGQPPVELDSGPKCCGMGGLFKLSYPQQSGQIFASLAEKIAALQIDTVTTTCTGCLLQLRQGLADNPKTEVLHLVNLLATALKKGLRTSAHIGCLKNDEEYNDGLVLK